MIMLLCINITSISNSHEQIQTTYLYYYQNSFHTIIKLLIINMPVLLRAKTYKWLKSIHIFRNEPLPSTTP
jgi:hypothetical protein